MLVALSVGYWLGGRWADRNPTIRGALPRGAAGGRPAGARAVRRRGRCWTSAVDALDEVSAGAFLGSLVAVLVLVAVAGAAARHGVALGAAARVRDVENAGHDRRAAVRAVDGRAAWSARCCRRSCSIPLVGTRRTFLLFALLIAVVAVLGLRPVRRYALAPVAIVVLLLLPVGTLKASDNGRVVYEAETEYQYARVIERDDGSPRARAERGPGQPLGLPAPTPS